MNYKLLPAALLTWNWACLRSVPPRRTRPYFIPFFSGSKVYVYAFWKGPIYTLPEQSMQNPEHNIICVFVLKFAI